MTDNGTTYNGTTAQKNYGDAMVECLELAEKHPKLFRFVDWLALLGGTNDDARVLRGNVVREVCIGGIPPTVFDALYLHIAEIISRDIKKLGTTEKGEPYYSYQLVVRLESDVYVQLYAEDCKEEAWARGYYAGMNLWAAHTLADLPEASSARSFFF
jgi:hypothetical protein